MDLAWKCYDSFLREAGHGLRPLTQQLNTKPNNTMARCGFPERILAACSLDNDWTQAVSAMTGRLEIRRREKITFIGKGLNADVT